MKNRPTIDRRISYKGLVRGAGLSTVYGGFRSNASENPGFDNFSVVPEPGSLTLLGLAGIALALRRRRV
jgi:hypothetical protein